jgi:hypothetical protein
VLFSQKCRSVADEVDAKTPVCPLEKVSNAAKSSFDALFQTDLVVCQNVVRVAVGMIGGARPSTRYG